MRALNKRYSSLPKRSKVWNLSRNFVPGHGPLDAKLMLLGQAPGRFEDIELKPFIGRSGKLMDKEIERIGLHREEFYITSVVQFYPPKNRAPTRKEMEVCLPLLLEQINIIKPKFVILLGNFPAGAVLGIRSIKSHHGEMVKRDGITYMFTLHSCRSTARHYKPRHLFA